MDEVTVRRRLRAHLDVLVSQIGPRPCGSPANRQATDYVASVLSGAELPVRSLSFNTRWWQPGPGELVLADGTTVEVVPNPFSAGGEFSGVVVRLDSPEDLTRPVVDPRGRVVVLGPALVGEPVMPKAFPFFHPEAHRELVTFLERQAPAAVIAVSARHASLPTFEDPDLAFASTTVSPTVGSRLRTGTPIRLALGGRTSAGSGVNLSTGTIAGRRAVLSAHVDAKATTPGAFDNAASVAVLLALVEDGLADVGPLEVVFFNGEDHFDAAGEQAWLAATDLGEVTVDVNLDGAGVAGRRTGVATIGCPSSLDGHVGRLVAARPDWTRMPPWFESDHAIFAFRSIPAIAITSDHVHDLFSTVAHTAADTLDLVDVDTLAGIVAVLRELLPAVHATVTVPVGH